MTLKDATSIIETLSPRQKEILRLITQHHQGKEVARLLNISESTVKTHTDAARRRLGVATSRDAARLLAAYEAQTSILPDGGYPSRGIGEQSGDGPVLAHEHTLSSERTILPGALERSGDSLENVGSTRAAIAGRGDATYGTSDRQERWTGKSRLHDDRGDRLADRRWGKFERRLEAISVWQWFGLIAITGVLLPLVGGVLIESAMVTLRAIHEFKSHTG